MLVYVLLAVLVVNGLVVFIGLSNAMNSND